MTADDTIYEAEGYMAADLNDLIENAMQKSLLRQMLSGTSVSKCAPLSQQTSDIGSYRALSQIKISSRLVQSTSRDHYDK